MSGEPDDEREALIAGQTDMRAEMRELRTEVERLQSQNNMIFTDATVLTLAIDALAKANKELRTEVERLRAFAKWVEDHSNDPGVVLKAAAALEPKP